MVWAQVSDVSFNEGQLSVAKARIIRNVELARKAQAPTLSLQQHLHLLPYKSDLYTPTGHLQSAGPAGAAAPTSSMHSSSSSRTGPRGLFLRPQGSESAGLPIDSEGFGGQCNGKRLADGVEALIGAVYLSAEAEAGGAAGRKGVGSATPVWEPGLAAAAVFCEATGVLPPGAAELACKPCLGAFAVSSSSDSSSTTATSRQQRDLQRLQQQVLGHTFRHPELLQCAVTHVSHPGSGNYQRLEYLGDSVLDLYVSSWLMLQLGQALQQEGGR